MMYGFGDDQNPYTESVELLEGENEWLIDRLIDWSTIRLIDRLIY